MSQLIDIDDFRGVVTHADLSDLPNSIATELKNFRPTNGKLVKTYDCNDVSETCPVVVTGWTVKNIYVYIDENLDDGYAYVAILRDDSSGEFRILWFRNDLAPADNEPTKLTPFAADSFWMQVGDSQTYVTDGFALIMSTVFSDGVNTHAFDASSAWHKPNNVDGGDSTSVFGSVPSLEGMPYNMQEALYSDSDQQNDIITNTSDYGTDSHASFTGRVKDFAEADVLSTFAVSVRAIKRFGDVTYCAVTVKTGSAIYGGRQGDVIMYHDGESWSQQLLSDSPFSYDMTSGASSTVRVTNFTVWDGRFYMGVMHYDHTGTGYNHDYWYVDWDTPANTAKVFNHVSGGSSVYGYDIGDVTTAEATYLGTDYLYVLHSYKSKPLSNSLGGLFYRLDASDITASSATAVALPTGIPNAVWSSQCIYSDVENGYVHLLYNSSSVGSATLDTLLYTPSASWQNISLPTSIGGAQEPRAPFTIDEITDAVGYEIDGSYFKTYVMKITDSAASQDWYVVQYSSDTTAWTSPSKRTLSATPNFVSTFLHDGRTGNFVVVSFYGSTNDLIILDADTATVERILASNKNTKPYTCFDSYEKTSNHLSVIDALYGIDDTSGDGHPTIYKFLSVGANPAWGGWDTAMDYGYSVTACVGWTMAVSGNIPTLYHKSAQNPIVLDNGILRAYGGALATIGANEVKNLWIGYINRDLFDDMYSVDSGFYAYENLPVAPTPQTTGFQFLGSEEGSTDKVGYMRYSYLYDGVQESLLSKAYMDDSFTETDAYYLKIPLYDTSDSSAGITPRVTGLRAYEMSSADDTASATLISELSLLRDISNNTLDGSNGYTGSYYAIITNANVVPSVGDFFGDDPSVWDRQIDAVTEIVPTTGAGDGVYMLECYTALGVNQLGQLWNGAWQIRTATGGGGTQQDSGADGGYCGSDVYVDPTEDFTTKSIVGLGFVAVGATPTRSRGYSNGYYVSEVIKYAAHFTGDIYSIGSGAHQYMFGAQPYMFYLEGSIYYLIAYLDYKNVDGSVYQLEGVKSLRVNSDYAKVISNRMWQGRVVLDVGGENEEQFNAVTYSELNQLDVTPVSNLIKLNDREGGGITGIAEIFGRPVITMKQGISIIDSKTNPADPTAWTISESVHNIGNIAKHGMVSALGSVFVCHYDGIYRLTSNNLAETDQTPTENLKISQDIDEVYLAISDKTSIIGEYDQIKNEVMWNFGSEMWAYSLVTGEWREIYSATTSTIDIMTPDENANVLVYDSSDGALKTWDSDKSGAVGTSPSTWRSKRYAFGLDRKSIVRQLSLYYASDDDFTVNIYINDNTGTPDGTYSVSKRAGENVRHIPIKRYCRNFQVEIVTEDSVNSFELNKIRLEVEE